MNKIMPQRSFSPRTFMGDRGIILDNYGRVLKNESFIFDDEKTILAPKAWKPSTSSNFNSCKFVDENLFEEAGHEIQTIILQSFSTDDQPDDAVIFSINTFKNPTMDKPSLNKSVSSVDINTAKQDNKKTEQHNNNINQQNNTDELIIESINPLSTIIENYTQDSLIEFRKIPFFSQSPGFPNSGNEPMTITPPTRTHNPITLNQAFSSVSSTVLDSIQGAEIGLLSVSPPILFKH